MLDNLNFRNLDTDAAGADARGASRSSRRRARRASPRRPAAPAGRRTGPGAARAAARLLLTASDMTSRELPRLAALAAAAALACAHGPTRRSGAPPTSTTTSGSRRCAAGRARTRCASSTRALAVDDGFAEAHRGRGARARPRLRPARRGGEGLPPRHRSCAPGYSEAHNDLGQLLARTGRYDEAIVEFDAALENMMYREPYVARCNKGQAL